jgi:hypothetical protein
LALALPFCVKQRSATNPLHAPASAAKGDAMKLTDEQRARIAEAMCMGGARGRDLCIPMLAAGMRELAKIHDYIAQDGWSCDASTALILTLVADDMEAK